MKKIEWLNSKKIDAINSLTDEDINIRKKFETAKSPLHFACQYSDWVRNDRLLEEYLNEFAPSIKEIKELDTFGRTPLHYSSTYQGCLKYLTEHCQIELVDLCALLCQRDNFDKKCYEYHKNIFKQSNLVDQFYDLKEKSKQIEAVKAMDSVVFGNVFGENNSFLDWFKLLTDKGKIEVLISMNTKKSEQVFSVKDPNVIECLCDIDMTDKRWKQDDCEGKEVKKIIKLINEAKEDKDRQVTKSIQKHMEKSDGDKSTIPMIRR